MVNEIEPSVDRGTPAPAVLVTVKETVGAVPAVPPETPVIFNTRPDKRLDAVGTTCAPVMVASKSVPAGG
jgi:hypothetical protein